MVIIFTCILNWLSICFREICLVTFIMCALIYRYIHDWIIGVSSMNAPAGTRICVTHDIHNAWQQNHAYPVCKPRFLKSVAHSALSQASQCWPSAATRESQCADRSQLGGLHARKVYNSGTNTTSDLPRLFLVFLVDAFTCHLLSEWWATSGLSLRVDCVHECRRMIGFFCQKKKKNTKITPWPIVNFVIFHTHESREVCHASERFQQTMRRNQTQENVGIMGRMIRMTCCRMCEMHTTSAFVWAVFRADRHCLA